MHLVALGYHAMAKEKDSIIKEAMLYYCHT